MRFLRTEGQQAARLSKPSIAMTFCKFLGELRNSKHAPFNPYVAVVLLG
jgi:hypothetical protein